MKATYIVRPGASFRLPDGSVKTAGESIELDSDVAAAHPGAVQLVPVDEPATAVDQPAAVQDAQA